MTENQMRDWARSTLRKYGDDCVNLGRPPQVKEQELLGFMFALIDSVVWGAESKDTTAMRVEVKARGGSFPRVP